jgi:carbon monoxide dehydrogenase subunit G
MVKVETSKTVNAPAEKIFSIIIDFEKLPSRFPGRYRSIKVLERSENSAKVEEDITVAGREIHQITMHTFEPNRYLRSEVTDGDTKGTVVEITLAPENSATKVSVKADLKLGKLGSVLGVFAKGKIRGGLEAMIDEFANVVNKDS